MQNTAKLNYPDLVASYDTRPRWAYSTTLPSPCEAYLSHFDVCIMHNVLLLQIAGLQSKPEELMNRQCHVVLLLGLLASLWLVQGQSCSVRVGHYDVLRNTSVGPIVCAMDQPQLVRNDARSLLHCSATCVNNDKCSSFNYKNLGSTSTGFICEHFDGFPSNFTVDATCRHYAVSYM